MESFLLYEQKVRISCNLVWNLVNKLKFRKIKSKFQRQLNEDIREIKRSNKVLVFADKTSNIYKLDTDEYKKLTTEAVTSTLQKGS